MIVSLSSLGTIPNPLPPRTDSVTPIVIGATTSLLLLALVTYGLRIWLRAKSQVALGLDDLAMTFALVFTIVNYSLNATIFKITKGQHTFYISLPVIEQAAKLSFAIFTVWVWSVCLIKISVCLMLLRIKQTRAWKIGLWGMIGTLFAMAGIATICYMIMCDPIQANWELKYALQPQACWSTQTFLNFTYTITAFLILTDVVCALLPIAFIRKINRPLGEKILLSFLMGLGLIACISGLVKVIVLKRLLLNPDLFYVGSKSQIWGYAEAYIGIIAANLPCLKSLLQRFFQLFGTEKGKSENKPSTYQSFDHSNNAHKLSLHGRDIGYHSAVSSVARVRSDENILLKERNIGETHLSGAKNAHITKEYSVTWDKEQEEEDNMK